MLHKPNQKPNVILLTVDSLRADRVGVLSPRMRPSLTPNIDKLAARSCVFTRAFAQGPYTSLSMPSLFTGRYPCRLKRMSRAIRMEHPTGVQVEGTPTITEILRDAGYHTAAFHSNPLLSRLFGFDKGFDVFYDDVFLSESGLSDGVKLTAARMQRLLRRAPYLGARSLHQLVGKWLESAPQPFFLWIHYMDVHGPYLAKKILKYVSRGEQLWRKAVFSPERITAEEQGLLTESYRHQIACLDGELGTFVNTLEERVRRDQTLLILTADHGDEFREHGGFGHGHKLYDELLHVPLLVSAPGLSPGPNRQPVGLIQIAPTIAAYAGAEGSGLAGLEAQSLLPTGEAGRFEEQEAFTISEAGADVHSKICVHTREWKLICAGGDTPEELYCLADDPDETRNLLTKHPDVVDGLMAKIRSHCSGGSAPGAEAEVAVPSAQVSEAEEELVVERLRDLGYLG